MTVYFIGAGPGDPDLLTIKGRAIIERAPVCLYAGSLVPAVITNHAGPEARIVNTASMSLDSIIAELVSAHKEGHDVARLHSGDPSFYSAIGEQIAALKDRNIDYEIVPGVPAFAAAAAVLGKELTLPEVGQTVILTRTSTSSSPMPEGEDLGTLARSGATLAIHLGVKSIDSITAQLIPSYGEECPAAVIARATWDDEVIIKGTLATIAEKVNTAGIKRTAIIFVGDVLSAEPKAKSRLYDKTYERHLKPAEE